MRYIDFGFTGAHSIAFHPPQAEAVDMLYRSRSLTQTVATSCLLSMLALSAPALGDNGDRSASSRLLWSVTPYIWAADTTYDLSAEGTPIDAGKVTFDDLIDTTDDSFQVAIEAGSEGGRFSALVDITYLETSDTLKGQLLRLKTESEQWFIDAALAYWPQGIDSNLNVFGGIRYTDLDDRYRYEIAAVGGELLKFRAKRDFVDALVGARYRLDLSPRWALVTRADYAYGDSDGIFLMQAFVRFTLDKRDRYNALLGYRYKEAEWDADGLEEDYEYSGPVIGFNFRF